MVLWTRTCLSSCGLASTRGDVSIGERIANALGVFASFFFRLGKQKKTGIIARRAPFVSVGMTSPLFFWGGGVSGITLTVTEGTEFTAYNVFLIKMGA